MGSPTVTLTDPSVAPTAIVNALLHTSSWQLVNAMSPSGPGSYAYPPLMGLQSCISLTIFDNLGSPVGDNLDIYIQVSPDNGNTWVDYIHYQAVTQAPKPFDYICTVSRYGNSGAIPVAVGIGFNPALPKNTVVGGDFTDRMRVLMVAGPLTTGGAMQTINVYAYSF